MGAQRTTNWIRAGLLALPVYGLLTFWTTFTHEPDRTTQVEAYARYVSSSAYLTQHLLGSILATILAIFGVVALGAYLANGRAGRLALTAMVMGVAGNALNLTIFGFSTIISPVIGRLYLEGQPGVMEVNEAIFSSAAFLILSGPGMLLYLVGNILLGVAVWRSETLPKWAGALYVPTGLVMIAGQFIPVFQSVAMAMFVVSTGWMALSVLRGPSAKTVGVAAQPSVQ
jgi:type IV secretory pathway VirB2 component (pilin)